MKSKPLTLCVDFDGVLHSYVSRWQGALELPDPPVEGAIEWLGGIIDHFHVVILTSRAHTEGVEAKVMEWLRIHGYEGPDLMVTDRKVPAHLYLDDRGLRFEGHFPSAAEIERMDPWNKKPVKQAFIEAEEQNLLADFRARYTRGNGTIVDARAMLRRGRRIYYCDLCSFAIMAGETYWHVNGFHQDRLCERCGEQCVKKEIA